MAQEPPPPVLLWGSGCSAGLAIALAAERPEGVAGVLAFSPSDRSRRQPVREAAARLAVPLFVTYGTGSHARGEAEAIAGVAPGTGLFTPAVGASGSAALLPDRNPRGASAAWAAVEAFLARVAPRGPTST